MVPVVGENGEGEVFLGRLSLSTAASFSRGRGAWGQANEDVTEMGLRTSVYSQMDAPAFELSRHGARCWGGGPR